MRADALRYFLLATYGGTYADADTDCLQPQRLQLQFAAAETLSAGASFLQRRFIFHPAGESLTMSRSRVWEATLFCRKDQMLQTNLLDDNGGIRVATLLKQQRVAMVDRALLYLEVRHSTKPVNPKWDQASISYDALVAQQIRDYLLAFYPLKAIEGMNAAATTEAELREAARLS